MGTLYIAVENAKIEGEEFCVPPYEIAADFSGAATRGSVNIMFKRWNSFAIHRINDPIVEDHCVRGRYGDLLVACRRDPGIN